VSRVPVPKRFTVFSTVENRMCKRGYRATFFGTRAIFIRAVPEVLGSVNRPKYSRGTTMFWLKNNLMEIVNALVFTLFFLHRVLTRTYNYFLPLLSRILFYWAGSDSVFIFISHSPSCRVVYLGYPISVKKCLGPEMFDIASSVLFN